MKEEKDFKISDTKLMLLKEGATDVAKSSGTFTETLTAEKLIELMKWREVPKLAKKSYTYDMRKILGQLTQEELKNQAKREAKELKVKRGKAKIRKLMERAL